mmetsp:Transcript_8804/g.12767  ORF Transcript_8804/g.12767 Transcript_8804/m.12767 type:complete len:86 (-) Transcript_8804:688-945(-)
MTRDSNFSRVAEFSIFPNIPNDGAGDNFFRYHTRRTDSQQSPFHRLQNGTDREWNANAKHISYRATIVVTQREQLLLFLQQHAYN